MQKNLLFASSPIRSRLSYSSKKSQPIAAHGWTQKQALFIMQSFIHLLSSSLRRSRSRRNKMMVPWTQRAKWASGVPSPMFESGVNFNPILNECSNIESISEHLASTMDSNFWYERLLRPAWQSFYSDVDMPLSEMMFYFNNNWDGISTSSLNPFCYRNLLLPGNLI